jgi:hypothetical protein
MSLGNSLSFVHQYRFNVCKFTNLVTNKKPNPTTFTKNWYPRPTPLDMQFEERSFQHQFSVSADKLYEWNIDRLSEQEVLNKLSHLTMVANSYMTNHQLTHAEIIDLLVSQDSLVN